MMLSKADILTKGHELPTKVIDVPSLGGQVKIRKLTARQRDLHEQAVFAVQEEGKSDPLFRSRVVAFSVVNEDGSRMFSDVEIEDVSTFGADVIDEIYAEAMLLSGLRKESEDNAEKNSGKADTSALPSV